MRETPVFPTAPLFNPRHHPMTTHRLNRRPMLENENNTSPLKIGDNIELWEGLDSFEPHIQMESPNEAKYPNLAGTTKLAVTEYFKADFTTASRKVPKRTWMGWFLWGDGVPPKGVPPGPPDSSSESPTPDNTSDFYSWQHPPNREDQGSWTPVRVDQQPLYLNPLRVNYNWPPGKFGYLTRPLYDFDRNVGYWYAKQ